MGHDQHGREKQVSGIETVYREAKSERVVEKKAGGRGGRRGGAYSIKRVKRG